MYKTVQEKKPTWKTKDRARRMHQNIDTPYLGGCESPVS